MAAFLTPKSALAAFLTAVLDVVSTVDSLDALSRLVSSNVPTRFVTVATDSTASSAVPWAASAAFLAAAAFATPVFA